MNSDDTVNRLRAAVAASTDNVTLLELLADTLLARARPDEAQVEYQRALALDPSSVSAKLGLARAWWHQKKTDQALVVLEDILRSGDAPHVRFLYATVLGQLGEVEKAIAEYQRAVEADPKVRDAEFEDRFGVEAADDAEVVDRRVRARADATFRAEAARRRASADQLRRRWRYGRAEGGDPGQDRRPAATPGALPRLWQDRRRSDS